MQIFRHFHQAANHPLAVAIGNFDGVHLGHQALLRHLSEVARDNGLKSAVMTFEPHPRDYFAAKLNKPELAPARIGKLRDKLGSGIILLGSKAGDKVMLLCMVTKDLTGKYHAGNIIKQRINTMRKNICIALLLLKCFPPGGNSRRG